MARPRTVGDLRFDRPQLSGCGSCRAGLGGFTREFYPSVFPLGLSLGPDRQGVFDLNYCQTGLDFTDLYVHGGRRL